MALENNRELIKKARIGAMEGEKGCKFLASEVVKIQGTEGLDFCCKPFFRSALWEAVWKNHEPAIKFLLDKQADVNFKDYNSSSCLHEAASKGYFNTVELLLERGAQVNARDKFGITPLMKAIQCGHRDVVELLLSRSACPNMKDAEGLTAQHYAAFQGDKGLANTLFFKGAWRNRFAVESQVEAPKKEKEEGGDEEKK